ncbi:UDP-diphospho-muramoylpentapeptide beta-N- acetylglucosaminyltransferase [Brevibacillus panacihumi W25]|uniref:UDP-N-acetylglucosamine--N-acetylmuramyl-(pentapeptide) pyrophosphoryl-undecaprenol N-acetylglucosamine transferase n=1 Tax=Brevibacillus panacihumi W25 TaxID=1408254 RepID=V6MCF2_9BACL|nr:undecaprenyldiphospho-muramoylpentapeptide beta-N-acetylglucosaminyltransferase [Brevibacillus panacihumi]EST56209.1 UDP-diphospho-muramoylpentapeptide beta-N- acetylglucosaminyltransferase [Brevibacillus panacihumi W25]
MKRRIAFTGGGSAGHVTVNLACIPYFLEAGWEVAYIGSENGIERELAQDLRGVRYEAISTGKLRRYFDWKNATDPFRVAKGVWQATRFLSQWKPDVIFSKGGFVSVPVVMGGWLNRIPVVIHESDLTPGLANRLTVPFARKVCVTFPETLEHLPAKKGEWVGAIVRDELMRGNRERGLSLCGFTAEKPVILIMGGSLGAKRINEALRDRLSERLQRFQIAHICGKGQVDDSLQLKGYKQFAYVKEELPDLLAMADLVVSRAGSNAIFEFLALAKPMLLIPLSQKASRGDQILNAKSFERQGFCQVLLEEDMTQERFDQELEKLWELRTVYRERLRQSQEVDSLKRLLDVIRQAAGEAET